jgi:hypothetical protein
VRAGPLLLAVGYFVILFRSIRGKNHVDDAGH